MNDKEAGSKHVPEEGSKRRPFDLEAAKRGEPLVTRYGRSVKFVAYVPEAQKYTVVAFIEGENGAHTFTDDGRCWPDSPNARENDLFMAPKPKRTVWVNFHKEKQLAIWYTSENLAKFNADIRAVAVAVPVQIEVW